MPQIRRTVLHAVVVVETVGSIAEHNSTVTWTGNALKEAHRFIRNGSVSIRVTDDENNTVGFAGHGAPVSEESREILNDYFESADSANPPE
jgi:hypothetical protein